MKIKTKFKETDLIVLGTHIKHEPQTYCSQGVNEGFEIDRIYLDGCDEEQSDVTNLLENHLHEIEENILNERDF